MKNIIIITAFLASSILLFTSCRRDRYFIKGEGSNVTNTRNSGKFSSVSLSIDADIEIIKDSTYDIELVGQQNILNVIETKISGGTLKVCIDYRTVIRKYNPITIRIHMPYIENVDVSGSGNISFMDEFSANNLYANVSGSGDIKIRGSVSNYFSAVISGSGSISHVGTGTCTNAKYNISGSGDIYAEWLKVGTVDANISGSGDITAYATDRLDARISGSGNVRYRGNPTVNANISGSGKVTKIQ